MDEQEQLKEFERDMVALHKCATFKQELSTMDWNDMWDILHSMSSAEVQKIFAEAVQESETRSKALRYVVKVYMAYDELEDDEKEAQTDRIVTDLLNRYRVKEDNK